jgi:hypothetical protein
VASLVLHTSPLSSKPSARVSHWLSEGRGNYTLYLGQDDPALLWLNWRHIESASFLENLCLVQMKPRPTILVLFVEAHRVAVVRVFLRYNYLNGVLLSRVHF